MSSGIKILPHYTYEEYRLWEGRWELIEGIPWVMSPAPSPRHQWISSNIKSEIRNAIKKPVVKIVRFMILSMSSWQRILYYSRML